MTEMIFGKSEPKIKDAKNLLLFYTQLFDDQINRYTEMDELIEEVEAKERNNRYRGSAMDNLQKKVREIKVAAERLRNLDELIINIKP